MRKVHQLTVKAVEIGALTLMMTRAVSAASIPGALNNGISSAQPTGAETNLPNIFVTVANLLIFLVGAVAVIMLIIGGLRYVLSQGNSTSIEGAKNTILYAIIGIIVAILAFAAVNFVVQKVGGA
jgi:Type IV secretion system pilin